MCYLNFFRVRLNPVLVFPAKMPPLSKTPYPHCNFSVYEEAGVLAKPVYYHNNDINTTKLNDI
jgi:hypothetical protein